MENENTSNGTAEEMEDTLKHGNISWKVRLYRRWNYYVIRELWKINKRKSPDLYKELDVSKRKYTNLITGDTYATPQMVEISKAMNLKTGADAKVFTGDVLLNVDGITEEEINEYYKNLRIKEMLETEQFTVDILNNKRQSVAKKLKIAITGENLSKIESKVDELQKIKGVIDELRKLEKIPPEKQKAYCKNLLADAEWKIREFKGNTLRKLKNIDYRTCSDNNLCRIEHYIRTAQKYSDTTNIEYIMSTFKRVTISELESAYVENRLQDYIDNLRHQYDLAHSVMVYHKNK